ncbi:hypothetical protein BJY00DRAFT_294397 [Aspergillus carlsbadensis]|nr:hypothetical protein BJY00DRAFT_294397 [Aspergillus carlsbadensis]
MVNFRYPGVTGDLCPFTDIYVGKVVILAVYMLWHILALPSWMRDVNIYFIRESFLQYYNNACEILMKS